MNKPLATLILAGGKGTRMGSSDKHKVCFEVLGVPVIIRALETYNLCGAQLNVVVVGMMAESVMSTVNRRFPGTVYAFQEQPLGTGNAARKGAEILERMGFEGDVLVVAGDKVIEPKALRELLALHQRAHADVSLATAKRPAESSAGILLKTPRGNIVGILEEAERQRLAALAAVDAAFRDRSVLARQTVEQLAAEHCRERALRTLISEFWPAGESEGVLAREVFESRFSREQRQGIARVGAETVPAREVLGRFDQMNLSTYVFAAPVLYDALDRLKSTRPTREEYLTDVFEILAARKKPARVIGYEVHDPHSVMAFNDPQELLAIEEVYRQRHGHAATQTPSENQETLAPAKEWDNLLENPSAAARKEFRSWYGEDVPWRQIRATLKYFVHRFGPDRPVAIVRSPGRINLMGRHIDHQGGSVNVMAINREIILVAAPRTDDLVTLINTQGSQFSEQSFRISDLVANLNWDDWQRVIDGPRLQRMLEAARGDWGNYVKAAILRLQELFRDRRLRGLDMLVSGDIPMGAGLSSSSALVVATAEAVRTFNHLPVSARRLVSLCGEGEWFVGTRGGAADHAAIKLSHRGCVTRVGFFPFDIEDSAQFLPEHALVVCNSGLYAGKSKGARNVFNAKVTAYHIGRVWFKMLRPQLADRIEHLRDINAERLGLSRTEFGHALLQLPNRVTRAQVEVASTQMPEAERNRLQRLFQTHDAPPGGYPVRSVVLFGLSEMARARQCLGLLQRNDAAGLGRLMNLSHNGDRVSRQSARQTWKRTPTYDGEAALRGWSCQDGQPGIEELSGDYGCSLPELDRIVDIARSLPGVEGAQLAGAGLGGCVMVLVQKPQIEKVLQSLGEQGINAEVFRPIAGACTLKLK